RAWAGLFKHKLRTVRRNKPVYFVSPLARNIYIRGGLGIEHHEVPPHIGRVVFSVRIQVLRPVFIVLEARNRADKMHASDRKSTRLNSSHVKISYAVFCLKKKKKTKEDQRD